MARSITARRRKLVALALVIPAAIVAIVGSNITAASAWHADITGKADCTAKVSFTVSSWTTGTKGANSNIVISYATDGKTFTTVAPSDGVKYEFTKDNDYKFSDSFIVPNHSEASSVTLKSKAVGAWGDGTVEQSERTTTVAVPAGCAQPTAAITGTDCVKTAAEVTLKNDGGSDVEFGFFKDDSTTAFESHTVKGHATSTVSVAVASSFKLSIHGGDMSIVSKDLAVQANCSQPAALVNQVCSSDASGVSVVLKNDGKIDDTFTVKNGDTTLDTVTLAAGKSETKSFTFAASNVQAGKTFDVTVLVGDKTIQTSTIKNDCSNSTASVATKCDVKGAVLSFDNSGKVDESFTVTRDGKPMDGSPVSVKAGDTVRKLLVLNEDESATLVITTAGGLHVEKTVTLNCAEETTTTVMPTTTVVPPTTPSTLPTEVQDVVVSHPQLATTGIDVMPMGLMGFLFFGIGAALLGARRNLYS